MPNATPDHDGWTFHDGYSTFDPKTGFAAEWKAMCEPFVVAHFKTTGVDAESDELLEFDALLVEKSGTVMSEFSALVKEERPLAEVMNAFLVFSVAKPPLKTPVTVATLSPAFVANLLAFPNFVTANSRPSLLILKP